MESGGRRRQDKELGLGARIGMLFGSVDRLSSSNGNNQSRDGGGDGGDSNNNNNGGASKGKTTSRGKDSDNCGGSSGGGGGLGPQLLGEKIVVKGRVVSVIKQLGEGGFSFVYLVKEELPFPPAQNASNSSSAPTTALSGPSHLVLKITSIHSRDQRDIAQKEATLLQRLCHPSIIKTYDTCYRSSPSFASSAAHSIVTSLSRGLGLPTGGQNPPTGSQQPSSGSLLRPQHLILMEYCEGGHALDAMKRMSAQGERYTLHSLIIAFGQICNAVSYMHAQKPPIVHRDLKPNNFLLQRGAYKLCDFGSAVFGTVSLEGVQARRDAEDVILKTTTQMFRAPEMVDLYMSECLTQSTDVWALGCCLYSMAFFQNCFEEGSNLAILSKNYKIPDDHPYGPGLEELIDRMLTVDYTERADMTEVILCLSALYSGKPLPSRKKGGKKPKKKEVAKQEKEKRVGSFRTDGQGVNFITESPKRPVEAKKLNPNSAAARRRRGRNGKDKTPTIGSRKSSSVNKSNKELPSLKPRSRESSTTRESNDGGGFEATFADSFSTNYDNSFCTVDNPFSKGGKSESENKQNFGDFDSFNDTLPSAPTIKKSSTHSPPHFASADALSFSAISATTSPLAAASTTRPPTDHDVTFPGFDSFSKNKEQTAILSDLFTMEANRTSTTSGKTSHNDNNICHISAGEQQTPNLHKVLSLSYSSQLSLDSQQSLQEEHAQPLASLTNGDKENDLDCNTLDRHQKQEQQKKT